MPAAVKSSAVVPGLFRQKTVGAGVGEEHHGLVVLGFFGCHLCVAHQNHHVTHLYFAGSSTVETYYARASFTGDDIGVKNVSPLLLSTI